MPVHSWNQIKADAEAMSRMIEIGNFAGQHKEAIGLAHCQFSDSPLRFFVLHKRYAEEFGLPVVVVNPLITRKGGEVRWSQEGCMSFPTRSVTQVRRYDDIDVDYTVFKGTFFFKRPVRVKGRRFRDLAAFVFQHEIDHMNGINIYGQK